MPKISILLLKVLLLALLGAGTAAAEPRIAVATFVDHPALNAALNGVISGLKENGLQHGAGAAIDVQNAQGSPVTAAQIAKKFAGDRPDVILALSTVSSQAMAAAVKDIPIVFVAISDPVSAKLVKSLSQPGGNLTGTCECTDGLSVVKLVRAVLPSATRLGVLYNPGETNSRMAVSKAKPALEAAGISLIEATVTRSSDVLTAVQSLIGRVDAIYVPNDNTVVSNFEAVTRVTHEVGLAVFADDPHNVERGGIAAEGSDYHEMGRQAAYMASRILKGESTQTMAVVRPRGYVALNLRVARQLNIELPADLVLGAKKVYD